MKKLINSKWLALALTLIIALSLFAGCTFANHADADLDHKCDDGCGETYGEHVDANKDHVCDYGCSEAIGKCADVDKNHVCDYGCSKAYGAHEDADKDHVCDGGCREAMGSCSDEDKDHACDYGCAKVYGEHVDANKDHACDYGCSEAFGECADSDKDHACDYGCAKVYGEHADANSDHICDYGCAVAIGECADENKDHKCDNGCSTVIGEHLDADKNHTCDYGCSEAIGECADADKDHSCDYGCGKSYGEHIDAGKDHACDYGCSEAIGECKDADKDHSCDYGCQKAYGEHADANKDHVCDYGCKVAFGECKDDNKDHVCDYGCSKMFGTCVDSNFDHDCDYGCPKVFGTCADADKDHDCDYGCSKVFGEHADADKDHACDYGCKVAIGTHEAAANSHDCAYCGEAITTCEGNYDEGRVTTEPDCTDKGVKTYTCQICGATKTEDIAANGHKDDDSDYKCDTCGADLCTDHQAGETVVENNVAATCTKEGSYDNVVYCTRCGEQISRETVTVAQLSHTPAEAVVENEVAATCESAGSYDTVVYCSACKSEISRVPETVAAKGHVDANGDLACDNNCGKNYYVLTLDGATTDSASTSTVANAFVEGTEITVTADTYKTVDDVKYMFVGFDKNEVDNRAGAEGVPTYTFSMPTENFSLTAKYAEVNTTFFSTGTWSTGTSVNPEGITATVITDSTDADLEGLAGLSLIIPDNAVATSKYLGNYTGVSGLNTWGIDQDRTGRFILKNHGNYDVTVEIAAEYFGKMSASGNITVPAGKTVVAVVHFDIFLTAGSTVDCQIHLREDVGGDGSGTVQLDVVAAVAKTYTSKVSDLITTSDKNVFMDFGETSESNTQANVSAASSSGMNLRTWDQYGVMYFYGNNNTSADTYARERANALGDTAIDLSTSGKFTIYVKVTNLYYAGGGKYSLVFTRGSSALSSNVIGSQTFEFSEYGETKIFAIEIDPDSVSATSTNLQFGLKKAAADGTGGKVDVLVQIASENIFGELSE